MPRMMKAPGIQGYLWPNLFPKGLGFVAAAAANSALSVAPCRTSALRVANAQDRALLGSADGQAMVRACAVDYASLRITFSTKSLMNSSAVNCDIATPLG